MKFIHDHIRYYEIGGNESAPGSHNVMTNVPWPW